MTFANPAALGLFGFATTTWLLGMVNAGWFGDSSLPMVLAMAFVFGGATQFSAGLLSAPRGDTFGFTAFCAFGAFWVSWGLFDVYYSAHVPAAFVGWYLFLWGLFTAVMGIGTLRTNLALFLTYLGALFTFVLLAIGEWTGAAVFHFLGGYAGLITGAIAFYLASALILDEVFGADVLPLGLFLKPALSGAPPASTAPARLAATAD
jgi:succinate-acetate transporter protein